MRHRQCHASCTRRPRGCDPGNASLAAHPVAGPRGGASTEVPRRRLPGVAQSPKRPHGGTAALSHRPRLSQGKNGPRRWLRRSKRGLWYGPRDIPPERATGVVTFAALARSPVSGDPA